MKAVILGNTKLGYSWFYLTYKQGLLLNGVDVVDIDYKSNSLNDIKNMLISLNPDIVFTHLSFHYRFRSTDIVLQMQRDVIKQTGCKFVHVVMDARKEDRYMGDISDAFHIAFVGNFEMLENCKNAWKIPVYYTPYSSLVYDSMGKQVKELMFQEAVFTGLPGIHTDRQQFLKKLSQKIPIKIFETQSGNDLRNRTLELSASAKCILGLCTGYEISGYIDVRPFQYLGAGACMIIRKFSNMDDLIPDNLYYPITSYANDGVMMAIDHYHRILREDTSLMQQAAFSYIQKFHSCKVRI